MGNGISKHITSGLRVARDGLARGLLRLHVTPNHLTLLGLAFTVAGAACLAMGLARPGSDVLPWAAGGRANYWLWWATGLMILAGAMDILDGAVARLGHLATETGAFLDSTLDRFSDVALFAGIAAGFAWRTNFTYTLLAVFALGHAVLISYTRARAEDLIAHCRVGYWERGERIAAILIGAAAYQVPAVLWQLATLPLLTALRRVVYTLKVTARLRRTGQDLSVTDPKPVGRGIYRLALWRHPRGTFAYDVVTAANILWILLAPISSVAANGPNSDPIRRLIERAMN